MKKAGLELQALSLRRKKCTILKRMYYTEKKHIVHSKKSIKIEQFRIL